MHSITLVLISAMVPCTTVEMHLDNQTEKPLVIACYYTWYTSAEGPHGKWMSWGSVKPSDFSPNGTDPDKLIFPPYIRDISASAYPLVGLYDSDDPEIVRWHIRLAKAAGIDAFFVDWWGEADWQTVPGLTHDVFADVVLPIAEEEGFKVCLFDETAQFYQDLDTVKEWAAEYIGRFKDSPAYLHIDGKPVYGIYQVPFDPRLTPEEATEIKDYVEKRVGPVYWVFDKIANGTNPVTGEYGLMIPEDFIVLDWVDAFMGYGTFSVQRIHRYDDIASQYAGMAKQIHDAGKAVMLPVHPGLDNSRLQEGAYVIPRDNGDTLRGYLQAATDANADAIIITSFNEWPETTVVEPALTWDDPYRYLRVLAEWKGMEFTPPHTPKGRVLLRSDLDNPEPPRYVAINIVPWATWRQEDPDTFDRSHFDEFRNAFGENNNPDLRYGLSFVFSIMETDAEILRESVKRYMQLSEETSIPILINLDGQNWWRNRSDLWNWWDPDAPGYDPENVHNVEWTNWTPDAAVKICWRNWGRQLRVHSAPNIMSPTILREHQERLEVIVPAIAEWYEQLPTDKKDLLIAVKVGWEASIGYNAFHYEGGNQIFEQYPDDTGHDPQDGLRDDQGFKEGIAQLGYAAVSKAGIKTEGEITRDDIAEVTRRYLEFMSRIVVNAGIPRELSYTHQGGNHAPWDTHLPFWPAFNEYAFPGWSFYFVRPENIPDLSLELTRHGDLRWAAVEWWWPGQDAAAWEDNIRSVLEFKNCRFICIYNWRGLQEHPDGIEAIRNLLMRWPK